MRTNMTKKASGKTVALVQARLGSSRLPMKSLLCLRNFPLIDWVTRRLARATKLDGIMVAVPDTERDAVLLEHLRRHGVPCATGPEDDVLARMALAARAADAAIVVRVCADNPLVWGGAVDRLLAHYAHAACDYAYNHIPRGNLWPDGLGAEMVSFPLLASLAQRAVRPEHREHCLSYIWDHAAEFAVQTFDPDDVRLRRPEIRLDVDTPADYRRLALMPLTPASPPEEAVRLYIRG
jgi:spore coat polysaccharide biosynthesis protein SpsF